MNEIIKKSENQIEAIEKLFEEFQEMQQNRSNYALEKFVIGMHDMPGRQRKQILDELISMMQGLQQNITFYENAMVDLEELSQYDGHDKFHKARNEIKIREIKRNLKLAELQIIGQLRESNYLFQILELMPKYTREQFEAEEDEYWARRLTRQFYLSERGGGINMGNLDAILQLFSRPGLPKPGLPVALPEIMSMLGFEVKQIGGDENAREAGEKLADVSPAAEKGIEQGIKRENNKRARSKK